MKPWSKRRLLTLLVLAGICLLQLPANAQKAFSDEDKLTLAIQESLRRTANETHMAYKDNALQVASAYTTRIDDIGFVAYAVKVIDLNMEKIYTYWYDSQLQPIAEKAAFDTRAAAYEARYGRLSRRLHAHISQESSNSISVAIWAEQALGSQIQATSYIYLPLVMHGDGEGECASAIDCIVLFLTSRGYAVDYVSTEVPIVYASIPSSVILELQSQSYVAAIYEQEDGVLTMESAARTSAAPWTWERGITGQGVKVAVLENDGVAFDNPYINGTEYFIGWWKRIDAEDGHATKVAGVIASTHSQYKGIAYDVEILSANALSLAENAVVSASDWAIKSGADIINASFGTKCPSTSISSEDKYFDWVVWEKRKTIVVSSGNLWPTCTSNYNIGAPGRAYNVITVGSKDDNNTASTVEDTKDDQFSWFSRYVDPSTASSNRLKPEIVATGERINTTIISSPWVDSSNEVQGTSYAAPIVAGQTALMMQRADWLRFSPEAVKAGIMATARWTELHDDQNWDQWTSIEKMGVGAIDTTAADNSLINGRIQGLYLHQSDFSDDHYDINFEVTVPERIRVIIVWSSHPSRVKVLNWILHDRLESDFDLTIRAPNGQVFGSYADEANYEIVEFMASETGTYRARIHLSRWDNSTMEERVGFAWYSGASLP